MNRFTRDVTYQGNIRLVGGVPIARDADFAILYERDNYLEIVKKFFNLEAKDIEQHEDHKLLHYTLPNRAKVVMADAQGAAFSASAVEKFIRAGVSHVVRVGTCGAMDPDIKPWDFILNNAAVIDEGTSKKYIEKEKSIFKSILDELMCPIGIFNHTYKTFPSILKKIISIFNKEPYKNFISFSDSYLDEMLAKEIQSNLNGLDIRLHKGMNYTTSARFRQSKEIISTLVKELSIKSIDMETSAILSVATFHGISASIINIRTDNPTDESETKRTKTNLKSTFHGIPDHNLYKNIIPERIVLCTRCIMEVFRKISDDDSYKKFVDHDENND